MANTAIELVSQSEQQKSRDEQNGPLKPSFKAWALEAWRFTLTSGAFASFLVALINAITLIAICAKYPISNGQVTFFTGSCHTSSVVTTVAHVIINILSTILLAYSNFSMQCLYSPTRKEVDSAHSRQHWLSIGTPSVRNLFFISKNKVLLVLLLGASSFPLHMIWNSVVFETESTHDYIAVTVTENFKQGATWSVPSQWSSHRNSSWNLPTSTYHDIIGDLQRQVQANELEELDSESCFEAYYTSILPNRRHVLLVVDAHDLHGYAEDWRSFYHTNSSVLAIWDHQFVGENGNMYEWLFQSTRDNWVPDNPTLGDQEDAPVRKCYSQKTIEQCKTSLVPVLLVIVIVCNIIKGCCGLLALHLTRADPSLCTTGDAIQSFLNKPDLHTQGRCLVSKKDFEKLFPGQSDDWNSRPLNIGDIWTGGRDRWYTAVNTWYWSLCMSLWLAIVVLVSEWASGLLSTGDNSSGSLDGIGIGSSVLSSGTPASGYQLPGEIYVPALFILVNIPQTLVSYFYFGVSNILSTMLAMEEWCGYSAGSKKGAKGLRVSSPVPDTEQRSTYFLSVPYKWSIPTTITMAVIHWLVSEAFVFAQVDVHSDNPNASSPIDSLTYAIIGGQALSASLYIAIAGVAIMFGIAFFMKYPASIPLAGCCSSSIAAACQPSRQQNTASGQNTIDFPPDLANRKLQWGVLQSPDVMEYGIGHATFSELEITPLEEEKMYT